MAMKGLPYEHEVMKRVLKNALVLSAKIEFSILRLRHQIYAISGLAKRTYFKSIRVAYCSPILQQYIGMVLLPPNFASDRVMKIL